MKKETWKPINGCEEFYLISNFGNVKSIKSGLIKKPTVGKRGYYTVMLSLGRAGNYKLKTVHRLIAEHFIPNPKNKNFVNHKDGNRLNNDIDNLEWCTNGENIQHAYNMGLMKQKKAVRQLTKSGVVGKVWETLTHTRRFFGMNASNIVQVCQSKRKSAYGYKWEYV